MEGDNTRDRWKDSITERVSRGEISCKQCGVLATEPVKGWSFMMLSGDSYCPAHQPLGVSFPEET